MNRPMKLIKLQMPFVEEVIRDERWYLGEERGCPVSPHDPELLRRVHQIVMREGARFRQRAEQQLPN